jgi:hypothetical protein
MTTVDTTPKLPRKPTSHRAMQRRLERYAAMGPNCPNGHPWAQHAKFSNSGYRLCDACTREKADERRNDPATYTGSCPHGHAYTRENTMNTCLNQKLCTTCKQKPDARPRSLKPGEMAEILKRRGIMWDASPHPPPWSKFRPRPVALRWKQCRPVRRGGIESVYLGC